MGLNFKTQQSAYFIIDSDDIRSLGDYNDRVVSLSITEEQGKLITGSVVFNDKDIQMFDILERAAIVNIEWGYKDPKQALQQLIARRSNPTEITGPIFRQGLKVMLTSPTTLTKPTGEVTTSMNFRSGFSMIRERKTRSFQGTRGSVVGEVLLKAGITTSFIIFNSQFEPIRPGKTAIKQSSETDFQFLRRLANKWGVLFRLGHTPTGEDTAIFADHATASALPFGSVMTGGVGNEHRFDWKGGNVNVKEYKCEYVLKQDGGGDNVRLSIIDNKVVTNRSEAKEGKVKGFRLNTGAIKTAFRSLKTIGEKQRLMLDILDATDFQDKRIKKFWKETDYSTALQVGGFKITLKTFGNPLFTPPNDVIFRNGFPTKIQTLGDIFGVNSFKMRRVTHTINKQGFDNEIEVRNFYKF